MTEPVWIPRAVIEHIHFEQIQEHGGAHGLRDEAVLESILARPRNKWEYQSELDLAPLAAACGYGLAMGHPFLDGNKRVALMAMYVFLGTNGMELDAEEAEAVEIMWDLARGEVTEDALAEWLRSRISISE